MAEGVKQATRLHSQLRGLSGVAVADAQGAVVERAGELDAETLCAVGVVATSQLSLVGELLGAGKLRRWYVVGEGQTMWVNANDAEVVVAVGPEAKNPEPTSKLLTPR